MDDETLRRQLAAAHDGGRAAFEALYRELAPPLYAVLCRLIGDRHLAEDLLQELFLRLYRDPPTHAARPRAYVFRMARNLAVDALRARPAETPLPDTAAEDPAEGWSDRVDVARAVARLGDADRQIVALHVHGGLKFREVAEIVSMPLGTVLWRYRRALEKLRADLEGGRP